MNKSGFFFAFFLLSVFFQFCSEKEPNQEKLNRLFMEGNFQEARLFTKELESESTDSIPLKELEIISAKMDRIEIDFSKNETQIKTELAPYFPDLNETKLRNWEKDKLLEMRLIDGERRYFKNAVNNLFRLDSTAQIAKTALKGKTIDSLDIFCVDYISDLLVNSKPENHFTGNSHKFKVDFTITLKPDVIPAGETVKCWMPFPRESLPRQKNIELLNVNSSDYFLAGNQVLQRSLYMEKLTVAGKPTVFNYSAEFETSPEYFNIQQENIKPYDLNSSVFIENTTERPPHLVFSNEIKNLANEITAGISNPFEKVKAIYYWINNNIKWASALEYSTFECIPEYVLETHHGDCGMQTLLFMSMARYSGIPCKWQSGWMLHPGEVNLHDWCEVYYEGIGWVPLDQSFGLQNSDNQQIKEFYITGIDAYRLIINDDFSIEFEPKKTFYRSEPIDFQRGELEWKEGNIYFSDWNYDVNFTYIF